MIKALTECVNPPHMSWKRVAQYRCENVAVHDIEMSIYFICVVLFFFSYFKNIQFDAPTLPT